MGVAKFQCRETSMKCTRNLLKSFHDICLKESRQGACDFSALGVTTWVTAFFFLH